MKTKRFPAWCSMKGPINKGSCEVADDGTIVIEDCQECEEHGDLRKLTKKGWERWKGEDDD